MKILQFSITEIRRNAVDSLFYFDEKIDVSELKELDNNDIREIDDVDVKGFITVDSKEIIFAFTVTGTMILPCARTLVDVAYHFNIEATEIFSTDEQLEQHDEKEEIHQILGDRIDLTPYIKENIILQMPYRVFSNEKGIEQGTGWELYEEDEFEQTDNETVDPRLAKLQQLLDQGKNDKQ